MNIFIAFVISFFILAIIKSAEQDNNTKAYHNTSNANKSTSLEEQFSAEDLAALKKELNLVNINKLSDVEMLKFIEHIDSVMVSDTSTLQMIKDLSLSQIRTTMKELKRILNDMELKDDKIYSSNDITDKSNLTREELNLPPMQEEPVEEIPQSEPQNHDAEIAGAVLGWIVADNLCKDKDKLKLQKEKLKRQMEDDIHFYSPEFARDYLLDVDKNDLD